MQCNPLEGLDNAISCLRIPRVWLLMGIVGGFLADKIGSRLKVIASGGLLLALSFGAYLVIPVTTGALYYYYKSKADMLVDVERQHIHYVYTLYAEDKAGVRKPPDELLKSIEDATAQRLDNAEWQRLNLMIAGEVVSSDEPARQEHKALYDEVIAKTADFFPYALGVPNDSKKRFAACFLIAALDGMAIQTSLGVHSDEMEQMTAEFIDFYVGSIRSYLCG